MTKLLLYFHIFCMDPQLVRMFFSWYMQVLLQSFIFILFL